MKTNFCTGLLASGIFAALLLGGCGQGSDTSPASSPSVQPPDTAAVIEQAAEQEQRSSVGLANPASEYCIKMNGTLDIVQGEDGEIGMCHLPDGTVIEEWELYRRDNAPSEALSDEQ